VKPDTVKLVYNGARAVIVPDATPVVVEPGSTVSIPAELAASLLSRDEWREAEAKKRSEK
jgi:hypothetical protein